MESREDHRLPCDDIGGLLRLPFHELMTQTSLFAARVEPAVEDVAGDSEFASTLAGLIDEVTKKADARARIRLYQLLISDCGKSTS